MTVKPETPRWTIYEQQVYDVFIEHFPKAQIQKNVRVKGRFSKRQRQIDILIAEETPTGLITTAVDTKLFRRKIDVKAVDALAGFTEDVGAQRGMLVTSRGFTRAAQRRAFYGPSDLELDILNFSELQQFQGHAAIPYAGKNAFLVDAPFGWIIDATQTEGCLANIYQRGLDLTTARERKELIYLNFWDRKAEPLTAAELDEQQVSQMKAFGPVTVSHRETVRRADAATRLRIADVKRYKCLEITGFIEFDDVIFFAVLLTPTETQRSNIRRLESVMRQAIPIEFQRDNTGLIAEIQEQLRGELPEPERARLLREVGHWYRDMDQLPAAKQMLEESLSLHLGGLAEYLTIKELIPVLTGLRDRRRALEVMGKLLRLDAHNPTVFNDCFSFADGWIERSEFLEMIDALKAEHPGDQLLQANCDFYAGNTLLSYDPESSRKRFIAARQTFRRILPRDHQVFRALRSVLRCLSQRP